jgi:hypothetical protein
MEGSASGSFPATLAEWAEKKVEVPPETQRVIIEFWKLQYKY